MTPRSSWSQGLLWSEFHGGHQRPERRSDLVQLAKQQTLDMRGVLYTDSRGGYDAVEFERKSAGNKRGRRFGNGDSLQRHLYSKRGLASDNLNPKKARSFCGKRQNIFDLLHSNFSPGTKFEIICRASSQIIWTVSSRWECLKRIQDLPKLRFCKITTVKAPLTLSQWSQVEATTPECWFFWTFCFCSSPDLSWGNGFQFGRCQLEKKWELWG